jgi:hypothetical protein
VRKRGIFSRGQNAQLRGHWAKLEHIFSPAPDNWAGALAAVRLVNEQVSVDALFADGITTSTMQDAVRKSHTAETGQDDDPYLTAPLNTSRLAHIFSPARNNWAAALRDMPGAC